jgi:uncharacterized membrane protein
MTRLSSVVLGAPDWLPIAAALLGAAALVLAWSAYRSRAKGWVRVATTALKTVAFLILALSLLEPLLTGSRPRQGANAFAVVVDNSQSLQVRDEGATQPRSEQFRTLLRADSPWLARVGQDFDIRRFAFDSNLRAVEGFDTLAFDGPASSVGVGLSALSRRFRGLPLAGVLLFTDGLKTDAADIDWSSLPPIYPVAPAEGREGRDLAVGRVAVSQTNFEAAPAVVDAEVRCTGFAGEQVTAVVLDESGKEIARKQAAAPAGPDPLAFRFQFRPDVPGVHFYTVRAFPSADESSESTREQTLANNDRLTVVDQGGGPYRVLYVGGRPNWEFKFLRRAISEDEQVQLVGLLRIAKKQPKFDFQASRSDRSSPFYQGFENPDEETAERADEAVLVRLGTEDEDELRAGFPRTPEELYGFHAIVLDDLESAFFRGDQLALLRDFVSVRGGGLLMLGGPDSFAEGGYDRTPVGDLLPVYLNRPAADGPSDAPADDLGHRLVLTREGWLQPWVRTRETEDQESKRLAAMPSFLSLNQAGPLKPGAVVLAQAETTDGQAVPALAAQAFGRGRVGALLVGDLWRWGIRRPTPAEDDFERAWRQTLRWLVADVPGRVDVALKPRPDLSATAVEIRATVRDAAYRPLDNATAAVRATLPGGDTLDLPAEPDDGQPGEYVATFVPTRPGPHRFAVTATAPDGSAVGTREAGWAAQPAADEFARLAPDRAFLEEIARQTGGQVIEPDRLDSFASGLFSRGAPITEPWTSPLWHQPLYFLVALACLLGEWGLRRFHGLP